MRLRLSSSKKQEGVQEKTGLQAEKSGQMSAASSKDGKPGLFSRKRERRACNESFRILGFYTSSGSPLPPIPAHWYSKPTVLEPPPLWPRGWSRKPSVRDKMVPGSSKVLFPGSKILPQVIVTAAD
ncbi:unnamed protein product [Clonostachys rosea f. rosea IK726]|uniref:Uncharacterized protein n=1 Tax=Clonostachys rosea f. rosea IK726 TaxID=1349383 RepID=A0ACA9TZT4_BIOOC|nr:unnamed protein product [Clonostachys rosea f. rosea IK726]